MNTWFELAERVRRGERIPYVLAALLQAATPIQRLSMRRRLRMKRIRVDAQVISVGNLTAGGTGKTPVVIECASAALEAGKNVAVLTRGYGAQHRGAVRVVRANERPPDDEWLGDEPELMARRLPDLVIAKGSDRVAAARLAIERYGCDTLILDDGYQYVRLERDENILVIDATNPFGNGHLLPRGILREPLDAMRRATKIVLTRCDQADYEGLVTRINAICPDVPIRLTCHKPKRIWRVSDKRRIRMTDLRGKAVRAVCGIGNPDAFFRSVEGLGANIAQRVAFPDHGLFPPRALESDLTIVTTEKDAVRLKFVRDNVFAIGVDIEDLVLSAPRSGR